MSHLLSDSPTLQFRIRQNGAETVVEIDGRLDSLLTRQQREDVLAAVTEGCQFVLDCSRLTAVSSIGLRMLLLLCRHVQSRGGSVSARGVSRELRDIAEATGFSRLFQESNAADKRPIAPRSSRPDLDVYPTHTIGGFSLRSGQPTPFGATNVVRGINFSVYSRHATACILVLFDLGQSEPFAEIPFPEEFKVGDVFAMIVFDLEFESIEYGFRMEGPFQPELGHRFDRSRVFIDPFSRAVAGREVWGSRLEPQPPVPFRSRIVPKDFDWEGDRPPRLPLEDLIIYEMHVRGFTADHSSAVKSPGTFSGLREKIPYLKELGVNCVELLPIFEFDELDNDRVNPLTRERLHNYWGYSPLAFFAPKAGFAATGRTGMQSDEFKSLVKELHQHGIEVILDVVFNHTAEGNEHGPTISFRGLDNKTYYMLTPDGRYHNFSGCGNTLNCNHPVVREFVVECLRHWVAEYHVDGFRFDLASILGRDQNGAPLSNPPLLEALAADPVLGNVRLIAEAWDAGGLYQVGSFPAYGRWAEWNGRYRDCMRRFLRGDAGMTGEVATRLCGSPDIYRDRGPSASINFITCHDGFTLADLVSYNEKHNEANGERNCDGAHENYSWNCGIEGPTDDTEVNKLRRRQAKNALTLLFLSEGVPMLTMGDECGRTQLGNNNAWCHDSPLTWFDWRLPAENSELGRFCRLLIAFRQSHAMLRLKRHSWPEADEVTWHGTMPWRPDWSSSSRVLAFMRRSVSGTDFVGESDAVYCAMNMHCETLEFRPPPPPPGQSWCVSLNTSMSPPEDIWEQGTEPQLTDPTRVLVGARSIFVLVAR